MAGSSESGPGAVGSGDAGSGAVGPRRYRDVRAATVGAPPEVVWRAVLDQVEVLGRPAWYVRLIGCRDRRPEGPRPLTAGSVVPGFRVRAADAPGRLVLDGVHRFSVYTLTFRLVPDDAGTRVEAHTDATFPGVLGAVYRLLVIDSGFHKIATRSIVTRVRRRVLAA
ncbi:SRPBCC family protein [Promicromonospora sp. NPDC050262]|uniref:SRPBCC family protein n=1 Tax=Promicromonospora sp. NPDC050262 TaxID=3155036 RepID=UPI0033F3AE1E